MPFLRSVLVALLATGLCTAPLHAQLNTKNSDMWTHATGKGPDHDVPGFLINLGPTGARARLFEKHFEVQWIWDDSPAVGKLELGDKILGVFEKPWQESHVFGGRQGYEGPMMEFGNAIEVAEGTDGKLPLLVERAGKTLDVVIELEPIGSFAPTFPYECEKSAQLRQRALDWLVEERKTGWHAATGNACAGLALLGSDDPEHQAAARQLARKWGGDRRPDGAWSWVVGYRLLFLGEYWLQTRDDAVKPGMQALINYSETMLHPENGGFGHQGQPRGYGPMCVATAIVIAGWEMAMQCGLEVDPQTRSRALKFLECGTGPDGHVLYGYGDEPATPGRASGGRGHIGRTGAAVLARVLSQDPGALDYIERGGRYIGNNVQSLADGHADNILGMCWAWIGCKASGDEASFRKLMDYSKAWLNLARGHDGSFVAMPGRDNKNNTYYISPRHHLTGAVAIILGAASPRLRMLGSTTVIRGIDPEQLSGDHKKAFQEIEKERFARAWKLVDRRLDQAQKRNQEDPTSQHLADHIEQCAGKVLDELLEYERLEDYYRLAEELAAAAERFDGVPIFDSEAAEWKLLVKGEWRDVVQAGRTYYTACERMRDKPVPTQIKTLQRLLKDLSDSVYADAARHAIEHLENKRPGDPVRAWFRDRAR